MRGTPSCSTTSACFPMARNTWQQASADPTASPSGRACEVNTKRSCWPICRSTSSSTSLCLFSTGLFGSFAALLRSIQQLFHSRFVLFGAVQPEVQFRCAPESQPIHQLMADIFPRRFQTFETLVSFRVIAFHVHPNFGRTPVIRHMDGCH